MKTDILYRPSYSIAKVLVLFMTGFSPNYRNLHQIVGGYLLADTKNLYSQITQDANAATINSIL